MDEDILITHTVQRISAMVVEWSRNKPAAMQDLARADELKKQQVSSLLQLATTKINAVTTSLLDAFNQLVEKFKNESEEDQASLARARVFMIDLMAQCLAFNWNTLKKNAVTDESAADEIKMKQRESVLPSPLSESLAGKMLDVICCKYLLGSPGPHSGAELKDKAGKLMFQLSAYNWDDTVLGRVSSGVGNQDENATPLNLLEHLNLNAARLSQLLQVVGGAVDDGVFKKTNMQMLLGRVLVRAIWNWIDHYSMEFVGICQASTRLRGEPDKLFEKFMDWGGKKKNGDFWEVQTMLLILCPDIMLSVAMHKDTSAKDIASKEKFMNNLNKALKGKLADVAVVCYVDICKASTFVSKQDMSALRYIVPAIETELKERLFNPQVLFKTSQGNEVELMTDCLLASFRLSPRKVINSLFTDFLRPNYPPVFKLVLVNTLQRIVDESSTMPWNRTDVYTGLAHQLRALFQEYEQQMRGFGDLQKQSDKKSKAQLDKVTKDIEILTKLVNLFYSDPDLALHPSNKSAAADLEETRNLLTGLCSLAAMFTLPELSQAAGNSLLALHDSEYISRWCPSNVQHGFWDISSAVNFGLASVLVDRRDLRTADIHQLISILNQILGYRNSFLSGIHSLKDRRPADSGDSSSRALSSTQLEIALLIHLCSAETEIVSKVVNCFGRLCDEIDIVGEADTENSITANYLTYRKLANSSNPGRAAQQRAIRIELRRVRQTAGNFSAWEQVHQRWQNLTAYLLRGGEEPKGQDHHFNIKRLAAPKLPVGKTTRTATAVAPIPAEKVTEWNHYTGFLCALAGVTLGKEQVKVEQETRKQKTETKIKVADMFVRELLNLIVSENDMIRETATELAGSTLAPAVYSVLFHHLNRKVRKFFGREGQINFQANSTIFVQQVIWIVKHIMELPVDSHTADDLALLVDLEDLITNLVRYVSGLVSKDNPSLALQIRNKMCACLVAMMVKQPYISFNNEMPFRQYLVELIMEWISDFSKPRAKGPAFEHALLSDEKRKESEKLMQDVDVAAVRAISALLRGLPLPKPEAEDETSALKKYFTFFTNLIGRAKADNAEAQGQQAKAEHAVAALSNLISANIDSGLEYFVTMGYHDDLETRASFLKVLSNILNQGTEFDSNPQEGPYDKLVELVTDPKMDVVLALSSVIQITEADDVAQLLVRLFEANERTMDLLRKAIKQEVWKTETENTLFRRNSMATKLLAAYSKLIGTRYLRDTLSPILQSLIAQPVSLELDPAKLAPGQDRTVNLANVTRVSNDFLKAITISLEHCPLPFREICHYLKLQVGKRFPGAEHSAIGGFFMLRFLCPAIVAPDSFNIVQGAALSTDLRRGLVLTTKVLQNLANKVMFNKEPHMEEMNIFLKDKMPAIEALFDEMANVPEDGEPAMPIHVSDEQREADIANLHYHLSINLDKIGKVLAAPDAKERGSNVFLRLTSLLGQLGPPPEPSKNTKFGGTADISAKKGANALHAGFMDEHAKLDVSALDAAKIFYKQGQTKDKAAVFYFIARKLAKNWTQDQLIFYIMKTLQPELGKPFSIVVDLTLFNKDYEIATSWISRFRQVAPDFSSLQHVFVLHANYDFKKYSKKIAKPVSRIRSKLIFVSTPKELTTYILEKELALPASTVAVEREVKATFSPVQKVMAYNNQKEVTVKVSNVLFEIVTVKQHDIFGGRVPLVDLLNIASIFEINISEDASEFVLKYDKEDPKSATYKTAAAEQIINALRASKARYNLSKEEANTNKRSFRAADVPGTLLNMALLNLGNTNAELRVEAYNLLTSLCASFNLSVQASLWETSGICIPRNTSSFIEGLSRKLAETSWKMTLEFLQEALHAIEKIKANLPGKQLALNYITYWLPNLRLFVRPSSHPDAAANLEKTRAIITQFIEFTIRETSMTGPAIQNKVWEVIGAVPELIETVIDCALERANDRKQGGLGSTALSVIGDIFVSLASQNARLVSGKLIAKLLSILSQTNTPRVKSLDEHPLWPNITVILRILLVLSFENLLCVAYYLPELFFGILLLFSTGSSIVRATVHGLLINIVHSLYTSIVSQGNKAPSLRLVLSELDQQKTRVLFGLGGLAISAFSKVTEKSNSVDGAPMTITTVETVATTLLSILNYCSPTNNCVGTPWHARLLSLSTQMAYSANATLQPRAIIALGVLCHSPSLVTDDLMSQVLRTFLEVFTPLSASGQRLDGDLPISLIICVTRLFEHVTPRSKFFKPMFWLAMTLLEISDPTLFAVSISLLEVVLKNLDSHDCFADGIVAYCMMAREECALEDILARADTLTGISFKTSFSFAVAAHMLKGLRRPATKTASARVLSTFVDIAAKKAIGPNMLGYIATLLPIKGDEMDNLRQLLLPAGEASSLHQYLFTEQMLPDTLSAALLFTLLVTILKSSDSDHEQLFIYEALKEGVLVMPEAFPVIYDVLIPKMSYIIEKSQNQEIIEACLSITKSMFAPEMTSVPSKKRLNKEFLASKTGFQGLPDMSEFEKAKSAKTGELVKIVCQVVEQMFKLRP